MMQRKMLTLVALLAALVFVVDPTSAFESTSVDRRVGAEVVADTNAYDDINIGSCTARKLTAATCTWGNVVNQGTTDLVYKLSMTTGPSSVTQWCVGGQCASSGTAVSATIPVGTTAQLTATVNACFSCTSTGTLWQLEGEKPNILNSLHTGISMTITWIA